MALDEKNGGGQAAATPLYRQLANLMRDKIYAKSWAPREKLPSEHDLMEEFGIARGTVRRAIKVLVEEGLLVREHGPGTFIAPSGPTYPAGVRPLSFADSLHDQGLTFVTRVLHREVTGAPASIAIELELEPGDPVMFMRRVREVGGEPIICQESWSNLRECPGLEEADCVTESLFEAVERCSGRKVKYSVARYSALAAGKEYGDYLKCDEKTPILLLEQTIRLEDDVPIERSRTWLKPGQAVMGIAVQPEFR